MKTNRGSFFLSLMLLALVALAAPEGNDGKLQSALAWLHKVAVGFSPELKQDVPAIEAILTRYFKEPDSLRASEEEIAVYDDVIGRFGAASNS